MNSLRARLLLVTAILLALSLGAAALLSSRFAARRFEHLVRLDGSGPGREVLDLVAGWPADSAAAAGRLAEFSERTRRAAAWLRDGRPGPVFAPGSAAPPRVVVRGEETELAWSDDGGERVVVLRGGVAVPGRPGDLLVVGPRPPEPGPVEAAVSDMNRSLAVAAAAIGLAGVALAFALSRRILGPVEQLTRAARRMESGDLSARVPVSSRDEIGALAQAFNAMAGRLEHTERLRRDLVGDVAHELRTPLTNLRAQIEAVQDGLLSPAAATLASLHDEVTLLQRLVDDLQDLALAEAGRLRLEVVALAPRAALDRAAAAMAAAAAAAGVEVRVEAVDEMPDVRADGRRLAQILRNLLANAILHTPAGGRVTLGAREDGGAIAFTVRDTGHGIAPEHVPHVFERFWRGDPSRDRATGGAGLGLAIVQQMVRAHGGEVAVTSRPGEGATFRFTLPAA